MTSNEQLPLDMKVERTPWGKWVDPQRRARESASAHSHERNRKHA